MVSVICTFTGALPFTWNPVANPSTASLPPLRTMYRTAGSLWHCSSTGPGESTLSTKRSWPAWQFCNCVGRGIAIDRRDGRPSASSAVTANQSAAPGTSPVNTKAVSEVNATLSMYCAPRRCIT